MNTALIKVGRSEKNCLLVEYFIKNLDLPEITKLLALKKYSFLRPVFLITSHISIDLLLTYKS